MGFPAMPLGSSMIEVKKHNIFTHLVFQLEPNISNEDSALKK